MMNSDAGQAKTLTTAISPAQHAVLDYGVAATFLAFGFSRLSRHRPAAALAFVNGAMILGMSLLTNYPGGVLRALTFRMHRSGDIAQAALAGLGPIFVRVRNRPGSHLLLWSGRKRSWRYCCYRLGRRSCQG